MTTTSTRTSTRKRRIDPDTFDEETAPFETEAKEEPAPPARRSRRAQREEPVAEETGDEEQDGEETIIPISRGRKAIKENRPSVDSGYFKWNDDGESVVVKFLDVEPWSYNQHWVTRAGKQSFPCIGKDCPLCEIGAKITQKVVYTLLNLSLDEPAVQTLEVTPTLDDTLSAYDADKKTGPLPRLYWALSRTKLAKSNSFAKYNYNFLPIKERDLGEDYGIDLDTAEDALEEAEAPDPATVLGKTTRRMLQEIADESMEH